jgi:SAM-dependent methyltransferase
MTAIAVLPPEIACPSCGGSLGTSGELLRCATDGDVGRVTDDGRLEFDRDDAYWGEVDRELMRRIDQAARRHGWRRALEEELRPSHPHLVDYVHHPARGDWFVLLPLDRSRTVALDVGAGWGANSFAVAPHVARVYAAEKIAERLEFVAIRAAQDGCRNVVPVRADLHALPFAPASLDVVIVNGVLEWAGLVDPQAPAGGRRRTPVALQEEFLRRLARLLRPGGWIYIGIENRFGRMFLRGAADHQGLRYTSLMPKQVARAYTWLRGATSPRTYVQERDYRTWIYSYGGYARLLERCGFTELERYAAIPGYNVPTRIVPLATPGPLLYLSRRERSPRAWRSGVRRGLDTLLARTGLEARISSCFALVARRREETPT